MPLEPRSHTFPTHSPHIPHTSYPPEGALCHLALLPLHPRMALAGLDLVPPPLGQRQDQVGAIKRQAGFNLQPAGQGSGLKFRGFIAQGDPQTSARAILTSGKRPAVNALSGRNVSSEAASNSASSLQGREKTIKRSISFITARRLLL